MSLGRLGTNTAHLSSVVATGPDHHIQSLAFNNKTVQLMMAQIYISRYRNTSFSISATPSTSPAQWILHPSLCHSKYPQLVRSVTVFGTHWMVTPRLMNIKVMLNSWNKYEVNSLQVDQTIWIKPSSNE